MQYKRLYEKIMFKLVRMQNLLVESRMDNLSIDDMNNLDYMQSYINDIILKYGMDNILEIYNFKIFVNNGLLYSLSRLNDNSILVSFKYIDGVKDYYYDTLDNDSARAIYDALVGLFAKEDTMYPDFYEFDDFD